MEISQQTIATIIPPIATVGRSQGGNLDAQNIETTTLAPGLSADLPTTSTTLALGQLLLRAHLMGSLPTQRRNVQRQKRPRQLSSKQLQRRCRHHWFPQHPAPSSSQPP